MTEHSKSKPSHGEQARIQRDNVRIGVSHNWNDNTSPASKLKMEDELSIRYWLKQ